MSKKSQEIFLQKQSFTSRLKEDMENIIVNNFKIKYYCEQYTGGKVCINPVDVFISQRGHWAIVFFYFLDIEYFETSQGKDFNVNLNYNKIIEYLEFVRTTEVENLYYSINHKKNPMYGNMMFFFNFLNEQIPEELLQYYVYENIHFTSERKRHIKEKNNINLFSPQQAYMMLNILDDFLKRTKDTQFFTDEKKEDYRIAIKSRLNDLLKPIASIGRGLGNKTNNDNEEDNSEEEDVAKDLIKEFKDNSIENYAFLESKKTSIIKLVSKIDKEIISKFNYRHSKGIELSDNQKEQLALLERNKNDTLNLLAKKNVKIKRTKIPIYNLQKEISGYEVVKEEETIEFILPNIYDFAKSDLKDNIENAGVKSYNVESNKQNAIQDVRNNLITEDVISALDFKRALLENNDNDEKIIKPALLEDMQVDVDNNENN